MANVPCGKCSICCEWGGDQSIAPPLSRYEAMKFESVTHNGKKVLQMNKQTGNCIYLVEISPGYMGCHVHDAVPEYCRNYDCRDIVKATLDQKENLFARVLMRGAVLLTERGEKPWVKEEK